MSIPDIKNILIDEDNYQKIMEEEILPFINERKTELLLSRDDGKKLYCLRYSPEEPEAAVVISHGFTETTAKFAEMVFYFLKANYAVYVYDHCGHGKSYRLTDNPDKVHADSYKRYVNDLLLVSRAAKKTYPELDLFLFGHSMGGGIAAAAAGYAPEMFSKIVLSSPMIRPATGNFPWFVTRLVCWLFVRIGKAEDFAPGQHPFSEKEDFETSAATSRARYEYYSKIRKSDRLFQMNGATYGWLYAGVRMNSYLQGKGAKSIASPVLLFQAENENFVINKQQDIFINKLKKRGIKAELVFTSNTKHEIYRSENEVLEKYLEKIFSFLN